MYPKHIQHLIKLLTSLPGVGPKTAAKYVFDIIHWDKHKIHEFTQSIQELQNHVTHCDRCFNYTNESICEICKATNRDHSVICVITHYPDLLSIESLGEYTGLYHILRGVINPIEGVTPDQLTIKALLNRIADKKIKEVILALNPDIPGETTALYLKNLLAPYGIIVTRIAKGLPMGSTIEYADQTTISNALKGRVKL